MKKPIDEALEQDMLDIFREQGKAPKEELMSLVLSLENKKAAYERYKKALAQKNAEDGEAE